MRCSMPVGLSRRMTAERRKLITRLERCGPQRKYDWRVRRSSSSCAMRRSFWVAMREMTFVASFARPVASMRRTMKSRYSACVVPESACEGGV